MCVVAFYMHVLLWRYIGLMLVDQVKSVLELHGKNERRASDQSERRLPGSACAGF